jgi:hypothetical protein
LGVRPGRGGEHHPGDEHAGGESSRMRSHALLHTGRPVRVAVES